MSFWSLLNWVFVLRTRHTRSLTQSANSTFGPFVVAVAISQQLNSFHSQSVTATAEPTATTNVCIYININWFCPCDKLETCSILHLRRCPVPSRPPSLLLQLSLQRSIQRYGTFVFFIRWLAQFGSVLFTCANFFRVHTSFVNLIFIFFLFFTVASWQSGVYISLARRVYDPMTAQLLILLWNLKIVPFKQFLRRRY